MEVDHSLRAAIRVDEDRIPVVRVAYLSYDGALDPLGSTQVVPYLEGLADTGVRFELITFEKPARLADAGRVSAMSARLTRAGIRWHALRYHQAPRVPATLFDIAAGAFRLRQLAKEHDIDLFHCRGEITPIMARLSMLNGPLLLDMRGFFADERVDAGSWKAGGLVDRAVRAMERRNLERASRIVVLTTRGREVLRNRRVSLPIDVIPTCADCRIFKPLDPPIPKVFDLVYFGSLGGWYMTEAMLDFVIEVKKHGEPLRVLFLTNNADEATRKRLQGADVTVKSATPEEVPGWLAQCRAAFFFIRATDSKIASCPTKLAEALAMGLPILTGPGVGDVDAILRDEGVGVVLEEFSSSAFLRGWSSFKSLLQERNIQSRCRAVAQRRLSLETAIDQYRAAYDLMTAHPARRR